MIIGPFFNTVYAHFFDVNSSTFGGTITATERGFCGAVAARLGAIGYMSANISASPLVSGTPVRCFRLAS